MALTLHEIEDNMVQHELDSTRAQAMALPKKGYFELERGRYGPVFPKTPACYGFTVIAKVKPGREEAIRDYGKTIEAAVKNDPEVLAPLRLHYLRWVLFDVGSRLHFMYQGIFDTDFDKYLEDAIALFNKTGVTTVASTPRARQYRRTPELQASLGSCTGPDIPGDFEARSKSSARAGAHTPSAGFDAAPDHCTPLPLVLTKPNLPRKVA